MDKLPVSIFIGDMLSTNRKSAILQSLLDCLGRGRGRYREKLPEIIEVFIPYKSKKYILVSDILLPFYFIEKRLARRTLGNTLAINIDVDYGCERLPNGILTGQMEKIQKKLKFGDGFGHTFNFLKLDVVNNELGGWKDLTSKLFICSHSTDCKLEHFVNRQFGVLKWKTIKVHPSKANYLDDVRNGTYAQPELEVLCIYFDSTLHAIQTALWCNRSTQFSQFATPFTAISALTKQMLREEPLHVFLENECQISESRGLGVNGTFLNIHDVVEDFKFVPFSELDFEIVNWNKVLGIHTECVSCFSVFRMVGISPQCVKLYADCSCPNRAMREWGAARLTMLAIRANVEEASMETGAFDDSVDEGLFPVIPGLRPIYNSLDHLAETVGQCSGYENAFKDYKLFFQQVPATIMDYNILKFDLESKLFECNVEVKVDKTELWSVQGITLLEGVTLVLFPSLGADGLVERQCGKRESRIYSNIVDAQDSASFTVFTLRIQIEAVRFWTSQQIILVPHSKLNTAVWKSIYERFVYEEQRNNGFYKYLGETLAFKFTGQWKSNKSFDSMTRIYLIRSKVDPVLSKWIKLLLSHAYVGFNLFLNEKDTEPYGLGRVVHADDSIITCIVLIPSGTFPFKSKLMMSFWVKHPQPFFNLIQSTLLGNENSSEFEDLMLPMPRGELFLGSKEILHALKSKCGAIGARKMTYYPIVKEDQHEMGEILDTTNIQTILKCWENMPLLDCSSMNLLFYPTFQLPFPLFPNYPRFKNDPNLLGKIKTITSDLTEQQKEAIQEGNTYFFHAVNGVPQSGTKRVLIAEILHRYASEEGIILVSSPSEEGLNVLQEKLKVENEKLKLSLNLTRMYNEKLEMLNWTSSCVIDNDSLVSKMKQHPLWNSDKRVNDILSNGLKEMSIEDENLLKGHMLKIAALVFRGTDLILATCDTACDGRLYHLQQFTSEPLYISSIFIYQHSTVRTSTALSLMNLKSKHFAVYGDCYRQLDQPDCHATEKANFNMNWLNFVRLHPIIQKQGLVTNLTTQFTIAEPICRMLSKACYDGYMVSAPSLLQRDYSSTGPFAHLTTSLLPPNHNIFIASYDGEMCEVKWKNPTDFSNPKEVEIAGLLLDRIIRTGQNMSRVGIISPYKKQCQELEKMINEKNSPFKDVIKMSYTGEPLPPVDILMLSMVRSNSDYDFGFLSDTDALTYALSRAAHYVLIICDETMFENCTSRPLRRLFNEMRNGKFVFKSFF